jgi:hypothetical protein
MIDAIRDELQTRKDNTNIAMNVHGQEGAHLGTAIVGTTDEDLRSTPE